MKRQIDMLNGSIADKILRFAIPLALTGILQQLFNAADVMVVGRFASKEAMAAVGSNTPIIGLMVNLFVGISVGANVVIAKFVGQKKESEISRTVGTAVLLSVLAGAFLALLGQFVAEPILNAMSVPADVLP
ncbi:MAG: MATE family efflux transporter, partial [Treponema sp.]|nr:MATE family efflux transporter [Treponema sp.]